MIPYHEDYDDQPVVIYDITTNSIVVFKSLYESDWGEYLLPLDELIHKSYNSKHFKIWIRYGFSLKGDADLLYYKFPLSKFIAIPIDLMKINNLSDITELNYAEGILVCA